MAITLNLNRRTLLLAIALLAAALLLALHTPATDAIVDVTPTMCPPPAEPHITRAAVQLMQHGWIIWQGDVRQLYVLTMSPSNKMNGTVTVYPENWEEGMPETDPAFGAPPGLRQPTRGIGKMWRENPTVRSSVGWALKDAEGFMMVVTQQGDNLWFNGDHDAFKIAGGHWQEFYDWPRPGF